MTPDHLMQQHPQRRLLDNRIPPPILALTTAVLMVIVSRATVPFAMPSLVRVTAPGVLLLFAGVMGARAFAAFGRAGTTINPVNIEAASALVTAGVYGISRNPMYVALTSLLSALAIALANGWVFAGPLLFALLINRFQIIPEERAMLAKFGVTYAEYKGRVRRWL